MQRDEHQVRSKGKHGTDGDDEDDSDAHAPGGAELAGQPEKRAHAEEDAENEIVDEKGVDEDVAERVVHECTSTGCGVWIFCRRVLRSRYQANTSSQNAKVMKPPGGSRNSTQRLEVGTEERDAEEGSGSENFTDGAKAGEAEGEPEAIAETVENGAADGIFGGESFRAGKDDAVDYDESEEGSEGFVDIDADGLDQVVRHGDGRCGDGDKGGDADLFRHLLAHHGDQCVGADEDERRGQAHGEGVADTIGDRQVGHMPRT